MNVYVESNFVLEHALQQEESQSCTEIIRLASRGQIKLLIPAFSLAEPHQAISAKAKVRSRLGEDLRKHLSELARSKPHREIPASFDALSAVLIESAQLEREGLKQTVSELLAVAEVIPLAAAVLRSAADIEADLGLSGQDAIVLHQCLATWKRRCQPRVAFSIGTPGTSMTPTFATGSKHPIANSFQSSLRRLSTSTRASDRETVPAMPHAS